MPDTIQRRSNSRNKFHCFARFRALEASPDSLEKLCVTQDFSHDGLYFLAMDDEIALRTRLLLRFPYLADSRAAGRDCIVEVVRKLPIYPGRCGVGVKLITFQDPATSRNRIYVPETISPTDLSMNSIDLYA
jgi:hypothetical protein